MGKASRRLSLRSPALQGALFILYMMVHRPFVRVWLQYKVRPFREQREQGKQGIQRERPSGEQWPDPEGGQRPSTKGTRQAWSACAGHVHQALPGRSLMEGVAVQHCQNEKGKRWLGAHQGRLVWASGSRGAKNRDTTRRSSPNASRVHLHRGPGVCMTLWV